MTDWTDETLRPLDELARIAFPEGSGVTAKTLKLRARQGRLTVYKPGKQYLSTLANVRAMVDATRVGSTPKDALTDTPDLANQTFNQALEDALRRREEQRIEDEWLRKYEARKAARKPPRTRRR